MSHVKRDWEEGEAKERTHALLLLMLELLESHPMASLRELELMVYATLEEEAEDEELSRKLAKDD